MRDHFSIHLQPEDLEGTDYRKFRIDLGIEQGYFYLTCRYWLKGTEPTNPEEYDDIDGGGCDHAAILEVRPDLKILADLHMADLDGTPMYAFENGWYWLQNGNHEYAQSALRATDQEYEIIKKAKHSVDFAKAIVDLGIIERWKEEGKQALDLYKSLDTIHAVINP